MRLEKKSLAFGFRTKKQGSTPTWETQLGQGIGYKIKDSDTSINELVKGLIYKAVPPKTISFNVRGKTLNGADENARLVIAAVFDKVYINETRINNGQFVLIIQKDDSQSHNGRLKLKYHPDNTYTISDTSISNRAFINQVRNQLGLADDACWFVTHIDVVDQDKLVLKTTIINSHGNEEYDDSKALHAAWDRYYEDDSEIDIHANTKLKYVTGYDVSISRNVIFFGAPGTGKSFTLNRDTNNLFTGYSEEEKKKHFERVTFHPDYSYAQFVGTYKPVMVQHIKAATNDTGVDFVIKTLNEEETPAQEKYRVLLEYFKNRGENDIYSKLSALIGLYTDEDFIANSESEIGTPSDYENEKSIGKSLRKYVSLLNKNRENGGEIAYEYVPGPFMRVYVNAMRSIKEGDCEPYLLIIEEINRANVAAVFGDVFQLLDRSENNDSVYPIQTSEDMRKYLADQLKCSLEECSEIKIPDNMFIWATMNSADQGVFPMDTAFKRRWDFEYLGIDNDEEKIKDYTFEINGIKYNWNRLRKAINDVLAENKINEDKLLGPFFIPLNKFEEENQKIVDVICDKVIMYLFEDAAKQKKDKVFSGNGPYKYSEISGTFRENGLEAFSDDIQKNYNEKYKAISDEKPEKKVEDTEELDDKEAN